MGAAPAVLGLAFMTGCWGEATPETAPGTGETAADRRDRDVAAALKEDPRRLRSLYHIYDRTHELAPAPERLSFLIETAAAARQWDLLEVPFAALQTPQDENSPACAALLKMIKDENSSRDPAGLAGGTITGPSPP